MAVGVARCLAPPLSSFIVSDATSGSSRHSGHRTRVEARRSPALHGLVLVFTAPVARWTSLPSGFRLEFTHPCLLQDSLTCACHPSALTRGPRSPTWASPCFVAEHISARHRAAPGVPRPFSGFRPIAPPGMLHPDDGFVVHNVSLRGLLDSRTFRR